MYHYLKWAALSYFFKRNFHYIFLILIALFGIYASDSIYQDLKDYAIATKQKDFIVYYLIAKWVIRVVFIILLIYSIMNLGVKKGSESKVKRKTPQTLGDKFNSGIDDDISRRLEKFRGSKPLRRRADIIVEKFRKKD